MKSWRSSFVGLSLLFAFTCFGTDESRADATLDVARPEAVVAGGECCGVERADDVWLVSTRHLGCPSADDAMEIDLHVEHYGGEGIGWIETSLDEFLASSHPTQPTMIYVHGNRADWNEAIERGWHVRNSVLGCSQIEPVRLVIWTWPSDQIRGPVRDVRAKAARTNGEAYYFAWFISQLESATPLSIVGHSFGARVTTGALHLLGGGELAGRTLTVGQSPRVRVALLAAALHNHWLQPGGYHGSALSQMDRLLIQYNSCDFYLKRYRYIEKRARPAALGYTGMCVDETLGARIEQRNVCSVIGKAHSQVSYFNCSTLTDQIRETMFEE